MSQECIRYFEVVVEDFPCKGKETVIRQPGYSIWHAIDQVYTKFRSKQLDRKKYKEKKRMQLE